MMMEGQARFLNLFFTKKRDDDDNGDGCCCVEVMKMIEDDFFQKVHASTTVWSRVSDRNG